MSFEPEDTRPPRLARSMYTKFAIAFALIVLCTAAPVATAVLLEVDDLVTAFERKQIPIDGIDEEGVLEDVDAGKPQTIVVIGSDRRFGDKKAGIPPRSDTLLLGRLDPQKGATAVMSIPRDLRVDIPGHGRQKINQAFSLGGEVLVIKTLREMGIKPSHVVTVNFNGFQRAVNELGCVYVDVDRRYFNDNNPPRDSATNYATIDLKPGYQKLCGSDSLDYVRFRHLDSDLVRAARQQDFLRQAKEQVGFSQLFGDRKKLLEIFGEYTRTDIRGNAAILRLLKLVYESAKNPVQEVQFPAEEAGDGSTDLEIGPAALERTIDRFMNAKASPNPRGKAKTTKRDKERANRQRKRRSGSTPPGTFQNPKPAEDLGIQLGAKLPFPVYYPKLAAIGSNYRPDWSRAYDIYDKSKKKHRAYRMVAAAPGIGQYYGVQGMTWKSPPILDNPSGTETRNGRKYKLYYDGNRLRMVAWETEKASYWVSNTLLRTLTNRQMLGIADSLTRVGS